MQDFEQNPQNHDIHYVCHRCVGDHILAEQIRCGGEVYPCSYCDEEEQEQALPLSDIAMRIHEVMEAQFELTPNEPLDVDEFIDIAMGFGWDRKGDSAAIVIAEIAGLDQRIADDIANWLSETFGWREVPRGGEDPYGPEACYEQMNPNTGRFRNSWDNFRDELGTRARFFGVYAETTLSEIFGDLQTLRTATAKPVVREMSSKGDGPFVYRGRKALSPDELYKILESPASELGPPPSKSAAAGRMNSAGVPVFYGAEDRKICVAEVRPPVDSHVVTGKFELIRTVQLLDLDLLEQVLVETSHFDEQYSDYYGRYAFLRQLVAEITAPVMPQDEAKEYLPTQVIADFLAFKVNPQLDGILFRSSQSASTGQNVVLFNHARHVEPILDPRYASQEVSMPGPDDDRGYPDSEVIIFENTVSESNNQLGTEDTAAGDNKLDQKDEWAEGEIVPTLRLHLDTLVVHKIKRTDPECDDWPVRRVPTGDASLFEGF